MNTKRCLVASAVALTFMAVISGCGEPAVDQAKETALIQLAVNEWDSALEAYKVDGMVRPLASGFTLTIKENGVAQAAKSLAVLSTELEANAPVQELMRKDGYSIKIDWSSTAVTVKSATSASVVAKFDTTESSPSLGKGTLIAEDGTFAADAVKTGDKWLFTSMTLNFNPAI